MRGITAIAIVAALASAACGGKKAAKDDCLGQKDDFLKGLKESFDSRVNGAPGDPNARAFFDSKYKYAEAHFDGYCQSVTQDDWNCLHDLVAAGGPPSDKCKPAADRMMKAVLNEDHPDY